MSARDAWSRSGSRGPKRASGGACGGNKSESDYEDLKNLDYTALDLRPEMGERIKAVYPMVNVVIGDIQAKLDFPDQYFDRI